MVKHWWFPIKNKNLAYDDKVMENDFPDSFPANGKSKKSSSKATSTSVNVQVCVFLVHWYIDLIYQLERERFKFLCRLLNLS